MTGVPDFIFVKKEGNTLTKLWLSIGGLLLFLYFLVSPFAVAAASSLGQMSEALLTELAENFDGVTPVPALPPGWVSAPVNGLSSAWATDRGAKFPPGPPAYSPNTLVYFNAWGLIEGNSARLYYNSPFNFSQSTGAAFKFWMYHHGTGTTDNDLVQVQVSTDGGATWGNVGDPIPRFDGTDSWQLHSVSLDSYVGQTGILVGLLGISAHGNDIHLDDLAVEIKVPMATLLNENFDNLSPPGKLPSAWITSPVVKLGGDWKPYPETNHPTGYPVHSSPNLIYFNSFSVEAGTQTRLHYGYGFDLRAAKEAFLTFWMYHDLVKEGSNDRIQVQVSTGGGLWQNAGPEIKRYDGYQGWKPYKVDLQPYLGHPQVRIGFLGISGLGTGLGNDIHLDDIILYRDYFRQNLPIVFN
jgi:hypothetical protein